MVIPHKYLKYFISKSKEERSNPSQDKDSQSTIPFNQDQFLMDLRYIKNQYRSGSFTRKQYFQSLKEIIQNSGWDGVPFSKKKEVFKTVNEEHLLPKKYN